MIPLFDLALVFARKAQNVMKWPLSEQLLKRLERRPIEHRKPDAQWSLSATDSQPHPPLKVLGFKDATLILYPGNVTVNGKVIPDSLRIPRTHKEVHQEFRRKGIKVVRMDEAVATIDMVWSNNYFHMLADSLFAMHTLRAVPNDIPLTVVTRLNLPPVMIAAFQKWLPNRRLIQLHNTAQVKAPWVVVPPRRDHLHFNGRLLKGLATVPHPIREFARQYGKACQLPEPFNKASRLFIGRKGTKWRRLLNEPEVESFLARYGFVSIQIQRFTNEQQFELFRRATCIVAIRGATVANLLAIEHPVKFVSIRPTTDGDGKQVLESLVEMGEIEYCEVCGTANQGKSDFRIDLADLQSALHRLGVH